MGTAPSLFIGSQHFPAVSGGPLLIGESDNPEVWLARNYNIEDIVSLRARTIRALSPARQLVQELQEIAVASRPVDVEAYFSKPVTPALLFDGTLAPIGLRAEMADLEVLDHPPAERRVNQVISDTDLHATEAVPMLYRDGIDTHQITQIFSTGLLGVKRHIVPTRWAITAVDDMLGNNLAMDVNRLSPMGEIQIRSGNLFGNQMICILVPGDWKFEMIEIWEKNSLWSKDGDTIISDREKGRKKGYSPITGAYYAARLAILERFAIEGFKGTVIAIRRVSSDYWTPLGVWVVREATRAAMCNAPFIFETFTQAVHAATSMLGSPAWTAQSRFAGEITTQRSLFDFFSPD